MWREAHLQAPDVALAVTAEDAQALCPDHARIPHRLQGPVPLRTEKVGIQLGL